MIEIKSTFKMALLSLKTNMMRSALTSLGIIIGVSAVIVLIAIITGANNQVMKNMESMGSNMLTVRSASAKSGGIRMGIGSKPTLTLKDTIAIEKNINNIEGVAPLSNENKQVMYGNQNWSTTIYGTTPVYLDIKNYEILEGRSFTFEDLRNTTKVAILGNTVAQELFGDLNPIDRTIRIGTVPFKVIGLLKAKGQNGFMDQDDLIFIPITTAQKRVFGTDFPGTVSQIIIKGTNADVMDKLEQDITLLLKERHKIGKNQEDDFSIRNSAEFQERMKSTISTFAFILGAAGAVALMVGGIGIMNIMLVSVTERTKEIGIRMAIGAKASDIRIQFLIESLMLSVIGGLIGVVAGILCSFLVSCFSELKTVVSPFSIFLSLGVSAGIGVIFGYYPARKASLLNPIDALRYE